MASYEDLEKEFSSLSDDIECWKDSDLQLAAELGKTLLERNKELENTIRSQQDKIEEQAHEIEYMKKQTTALREVNDSRLKIYEQLEVSIQDLERANHLLVVDNANDKKLLKTQSMTIENLEIRCEDIQKKFDDFKSKYQLLVKQQTTNEEVQDKVLWKSTTDGSINQKATSITTKPICNVTGNAQEHVNSTNNDEEVTSLLKQLSEVRSQRAREQKKISDLESQLSSLVRENNNLEEQLNVWQNKAQDVKNLQDELSTLEEVRQGHLCGRCLRGINMRSHEELTLMMDRNGDDIPEDDDISLPGTFMNGVNGYSNCLVQVNSPLSNTLELFSINRLSHGAHRHSQHKYCASHFLLFTRHFKTLQAIQSRTEDKENNNNSIFPNMYRNTHYFGETGLKSLGLSIKSNFISFALGSCCYRH